MRKNLLLLLGLLAFCPLSAQNAWKVTYGTPSRNNRPSVSKTILTVRDQENSITRFTDTAALVRQNPEMARRMLATIPGQRPAVQEVQYIDYAAGKYYSVAQLPDHETIATEVPFSLNTDNLTIEDADTIICGYPCKIATAIINSNTIKYWFTTEAGFNGTAQPAADLPEGLVLMISRNGNIGLTAEDIERIQIDEPLIPRPFHEIVDASMYRYLVNNAGVITVPIFDNESIGYAPSNAPSAVRDLQPDLVYRVSGGTLILKKVKLPESSEGWSVFAKVVEKAEKDAYDRTGSVFVIPTDKDLSYLNAIIDSLNMLPPFVDSRQNKYPGLIVTDNYNPPAELVRFFTPFGVGGYNHHRVPGQEWADSVIYHQDVTHLAPLLQGEVWFAAYIGNWTENGHRLSLTLKYHPGFRRGNSNVAIPVFNTVNSMEQGGQPYPAFMAEDALRVTVKLDEPVRNARLAYLASGHGADDEFNPKEHRFSLNGKEIFNFIPWREDCSTYRDWNPASGNFANGLSSSDLSRSNWCPGTVTNPIYVPLGDLPAGEHTFKIAIDVTESRGTNINFWCISGVIVGEKAPAL